MNEDMIQNIYDCLRKDLVELGKTNDKEERKRLSEEIKAFINFINHQDDLNLEWEKFLWQKKNDSNEKNDRKWSRWFDLIKEILKVLSILITSGVSIAMLKAVLKFEVDGTITSRVAQALFGRLINPRV